MAPRVTHSTVTGATADPTALVDGPAWDADHVIEGLDIGSDVQAHDADLDAIAALTPSNDDIIQRKDGTWTNRTLAQYISDLGSLGTTFQPLDSDLTAIAALATTSYGRGLLTLANVAALVAEVDPYFLTPAEGNAAYQPLDSDLTAIAALTTTSYGRAFLALADAAAARTAVGLGNVDNTSDVNKPFTQAGTGAVTRTMQDKAREILSVKDFGAVGDDTTDDTTAIQAAITAATTARKSVFFPAGSYVISSQITVSAPLMLIGQGKTASRIRQTGGSTSGVRFIGPFRGGGIRHMTIESGAGFISSGFSGTGSTGIGLTVTDVHFFAADDFAIYNFSYGVVITATPNNGGSWTHVYQNFDIRFFASDGIQIDATGTFADSNIGGARFFKNFIISNNGFTGTNTGSAGIHMFASGGDMFDTADITSPAVGVLVATATGAGITAPRFSNMYSDTCAFVGWNFDGSNGPLYSPVCTACWGSYTTSGPGLLTQGAGLTDLQWNGGGFYENGTNGWHHSGGANIYVRDASIARNSKSSTNTYDGVLVDANVGSWGVQNSIVGNFGPTVAWSQANGITISAGTGANISITGNNLGSPGSGKSGLVNGATGLNQIAHNLPRQLGYNPEQAQILALTTGGNTVAAGGTVYCGPLVATAVIGDNRYIPGYSGIVSSFLMACNSAPGASQSFTYTLMKNSVATSMTGTITGASSFVVEVTANPVTFGPTDSLEMRIVTSAGAAAAKHVGSLSVQP